MQIFAFPLSSSSAERLQALCAANDLGTPLFWRWDDLHRTTRQLAIAQTSHLPVDFAFQQRFSGLRSDVVVVAQAPKEVVQGLLAAFREWPRRPLLAIATVHSVDMPLAVLFEHLQADRSQEERLRRARASSSAKA